MAVDWNSDLWAWGTTLGDGTANVSLVPVMVGGTTPFGLTWTMSSGNNFNIAVDFNLDVWTWGANGNGQLGDGTTTTRLSPVLISGPSSISIVAAGGFHGLAAEFSGVFGSGVVWAWGDNSHGQLGDGTTTQRKTPIQVPHLANVSAIAAGGYHSLAISNGFVWAWGYNASGQLGDGTTTQRKTPVRISGLSNIVAIAASDDDSFAVKSDGTLWAWGSNVNGKLGDGTTAATRKTPVRVSGLSNVVSVTAASQHSVALTSDGNVWAWGDAYFAELGNGTFVPSNIPVRVSVIDGVAAISAGGLATTALRSDGTVWAWGVNLVGGLGIGTKKAAVTPMAVVGY
jgi:alpha-tubulin suppressor-like RCC1 family protein